MTKSLLLLPLLLLTVSSFNIYQSVMAVKPRPVQDIPWPFSICGPGQWTIQSLSLNSQPVRNANNDITVLGTATENTSFTSVDLEVKLNGVFLHSESIPFKASYNEGDTVQFKFSNFVPGFAPPGTYGLTLKFKNGSTDNSCLGFSFKL